jgi:6-phosphofructokinase 1
VRIGILTSGGDSPGMNGVVRVVAVAGRARGHEVIGICRGYQGLLAGEARPLTSGDAHGISRFGGTVLGSARSAEFPTPEGQAKARARLAELKLDALIAVGGNGTLAGAHLLGRDRPCTIVGVPASIDNDIGHCGLAIGVDTAVNTIVEACDRISDTAHAHRRAFIVEVMGRHCGFLAMRAGIAAEADAILYREQKLSEDDLVAKLRGVLRICFAPGSDKKRALVIKAEGVHVPTGVLVERLQKHLQEDAPGVEIRATILGHVVRGGSPTALDRTISQRLGYWALLAAETGTHDVMTAWEPPGGSAAPGVPTDDPSVRLIPIGQVLEETERLLSGVSPAWSARIKLLERVEHLLAM